ncbi:hypothetical protein D9611_012627 [Ephemerocybe angulata]|uniref:MYND-type domain-containing protein n=1 Tax=Ephemerocybe angulata TaxID=980116 RepID=A0A8H5AUR4_9AGAR|nr:hypothetical protein D9611_012627 [Tulosesus angulatus]
MSYRFRTPPELLPTNLTHLERMEHLRTWLEENPEVPHSLEILDTLLRFLDVANIPDYNDADAHGEETILRVRMALNALLGLSAVAYRCHDSTTVFSWLKDATAERIANSFDAIIEWMSLMLMYGSSLPTHTSPTADFREVYLTQADILFSILRVDSQIRHCLWTSTSALDVVIRIWVTTGRRNEPFQDFGHPKTCPINRLMAFCIDANTPGLAALSDRLLNGRTSLLLHFVEAAVRRPEMACRHILEDPSLSNASTTDNIITSVAFHNTIKVVYNLVTIPGLQDAFFKERFLDRLTKTAVLLFNQKMTTPHVTPGGLLVCDNLLRMASFRTAHFVTDISATIRQGLLRLYITLVKRSQEISAEDHYWDPKDLVVAFSRILEGRVTWKRILVEIEKDMENLASLVRDMPTTPGPGMGAIAAALRSFSSAVLVQVHLDSYCQGGSDAMHLCDNPNCRSRSLRFVHDDRVPPGSSSRRCGGCSAFVYCGPECQREDWDAHHSKECKQATRDTIRLNARYSHRARAHHVSFIENRMNAFIAKQDPGGMPNGVPGTTFEPITFDAAALDEADIGTTTDIYILDTTESGSPSMLNTREKYVTWVDTQASFPQGYLKARFNDAYLGFHDNAQPKALAGKPHEESRLAEGCFFYGHLVLCVNVKLRLHTDERTRMSRFFAVSSMARFTTTWPGNEQ